MTLTMNGDGREPLRMSDNSGGRIQAGLRIDVDTLRGTRLGVPRLVSLLGKHGIKATFFFSVGPDNMGRHLWRLLKPAFLWKMLRTNAPSLYGWDILLCGVIGQGPDIGKKCAEEMRLAAREGHEVGLHAWDHQRWQSMDLTDTDAVRREIEKGVARFREIFGVDPACSAAPAWRANEVVVGLKNEFPFTYNSDGRGTDCFVPVCGGKDCRAQVPVTLPTYDEMLGVDGVDDAVYNDRLLEKFRVDDVNVLCIHAEVEGVAKSGMFEEFLLKAGAKGVGFCRLDEMLRQREKSGEIGRAGVKVAALPGREGELCFQGDPLERF